MIAVGVGQARGARWPSVHISSCISHGLKELQRECFWSIFPFIDPCFLCQEDWSVGLWCASFLVTMVQVSSDGRQLVNQLAPSVDPV